MSITDNDHAAFARAAMEHLDILYTYALQTTGDRAEAAKLVEKAYVKSHHEWRQGRRDSNIRVWLLQELRAQIRRGWLRQMTASLVGTNGLGQESMAITGCLADDARSRNVPASRWVSEESITRAIRHLPEECRTAIILCDIEDLSYEEIAGVLECSVDQVGEMLHAARKWLHERLLGGMVTTQEWACSPAATEEDIEDRLQVLLAKIRETQ